MPCVRAPSRRRWVRSPPTFLIALATHTFPRRAYCSDDCENNDMYSPSISSSSSVLSSPQLGYALGGDVPSLMPSALGSALKNYTVKNSYSVSSSSSASSASWSLFTDEEDQEANPQYSSSSEYDGPDAIFDSNMKVQNLINFVNPSALSYTRIPSSTNNQSLVPQVKPRSSSRHVRGFPRSVPIQPHVPDDGASSDADFSSNEPLDSDSEINSNSDRDDLITAKTKRSRNRASLPACFSLLQLMSPLKPIRSSPISSSSENATVRQSPPTPRVPSKRPGSTLEISPTVVPLSSLHDTPRGRRREAGHSSCGNRSGNSSRSSSRRPRRSHADDSPHCADHHARHSPRRVDWPAQEFALPIRGRLTIRRSSSPLSRMISDSMSAELRSTGSNPFGSRSRPRPRGRTRVEDLEGIGSSIDAPGYGSGRTGLLNREHAPHPLRVPL